MLVGQDQHHAKGLNKWDNPPVEEHKGLLGTSGSVNHLVVAETHAHEDN